MLPGLCGGGPNSGWASHMLPISSMTSETSATLATMASSSMQGAVPCFDFALFLFFDADFSAYTFFAGAFFGCTFFSYFLILLHLNLPLLPLFLCLYFILLHTSTSLVVCVLLSCQV